MSAPLNHPEPLCPTFLVPAAQISLNTSRLYPLPSIRLYCWCGMPGMSTGLPILSIHRQQSTMQVRACACPDGFPQQSEFHWKNWHWCAVMAGCGLTKPLSWQPFQAPSLLRSFLRYHFCSLHCWTYPETFPLCQVALRNRAACLKYSCNASLGEEMNSSIMPRKCRIGPAEGQKLIHLVEAGNVCQEPRIRYPKES